MKNLRKILCFMIIAAMLAAGIGTAFAAQVVDVGTGEGSITVTNATEGKTYRIYKLFDATYSDDAVAYTYTKTGAQDAMFDLLTADDSPFTLTQVRDTDDYVVTSEASSADISAWIRSNLTEQDGELLDGDVLKAVASAVASESELKFSDLAYGYYFITSALGTTITIDSNTPDENVIDKNQGPSWDVDDEGSGKVIVSDSNKIYTPETSENSVNVGDTVTFKIGVNTTNYNGDKAIIEYFINDSLAKGFEYDKTSVTVMIGETELFVSTAPAVGEGYAIEWDDEENGFRITIPWYDETAETFASAPANNTITVTYSATLVANDETVYAGEGNKNTATYDFRDAGDPETPPPGGDPYHVVEEKETVTYTFALGFLKIDGKTKQPLTGAEFVLKNAEGEYLTATGEAGDYTYLGTAENEADATTFTTDANGLLLIKGVAEGVYTVIETKAPNGYNPLTGEVYIEASILEASSYTTTYTTYFDSEGNVTETQQEDGATVTRTYDVSAVDLIVENNAGATLPETGGIGTTIFYGLGGLLAAAAIILLIVRKRMG